MLFRGVFGIGFLLSFVRIIFAFRHAFVSNFSFSCAGATLGRTPEDACSCVKFIGPRVLACFIPVAGTFLLTCLFLRPAGVVHYPLSA